MTLEQLITALEQQTDIPIDGPSLRLNLPREPIAPDVAIRLARAIAKEPRFTTVNFQGCTLDDSSLACLLTELASHPNLKALDLSMTSLTDSCAPTLALLASFKTLRVLNLSDNNDIGGQIGDALLALLQQPNTQLIQVHLGGTGISDEHREAIQTCVTQNAEKLCALTIPTSVILPSSSSSPEPQSSEPPSHQPLSKKPAPQRPQSLLTRALADQLRVAPTNFAAPDDTLLNPTKIHERDEAYIAVLLAAHDAAAMTVSLPTAEERPLSVWSPTLNTFVPTTQPTIRSTTTGAHSDLRTKAAARSTNSVTRHDATIAAKRLNSSPAGLQHSTSAPKTSGPPKPTFLKTFFTSILSFDPESSTSQPMATQPPIPSSPPSSSRQYHSSTISPLASSNATPPRPLAQSPMNAHGFMRRTERSHGSSSIHLSSYLSVPSSPPALLFIGQPTVQGVCDQAQKIERDIYLRELQYTFDHHETCTKEKEFISALMRKAEPREEAEPRKKMEWDIYLHELRQTSDHDETREKGTDSITALTRKVEPRVLSYYGHTLDVMKTATKELKPSHYPEVFKCLNRILTQFLNPALPHTQFIANILKAWLANNQPIYGESAGHGLFDNIGAPLEQHVINMLMYFKENCDSSFECCAAYLEVQYKDALNQGLMTEDHSLAKILSALSQDTRSKAEAEIYLLQINKLILSAAFALS